MLATKRSTAYESYRGVEHEATLPSGSQRPRQGEQFSRSNRLSLFGCIAVIMLVAWLLAGKSAQIDKLNYRIAASQSQLSVMAADNASLTADLDALQKPTRILNVALGRLHMKYSQPMHIQVQSTTPAH